MFFLYYYFLFFFSVFLPLQNINCPQLREGVEAPTPEIAREPQPEPKRLQALKIPHTLALNLQS